MQSAGVNALLALAAGGAANTAVVSDDAGTGTAGQQFSQLLNDSGASYEGQQNPPLFVRGAALLVGGAAVALSAQEVAPVDVGQVLQAREQVVAPQDVPELLRRIEAMMEQRSRNAADVQALGQIKEQLLRIARGGEPKTITQLIQSVPAVREAKLSTAGLVALLSVRKSAEKTEDKEVPQAAAVMQNLQAVMFPARGGKAASKAGDAADESQKEKNVNESSDMSLGMDVAVPVDRVTVVQSVAATLLVQTASQAAEVEASLVRSRADLDAAIPPLKLEVSNDLPEVELPQWKAPVAAVKSDAVGGDFQALAAAAVKDGAKLPTEMVVGERDANSSDVSALLNPSHANGFSPTQTAKAAQPINLVPTHGYINHAPVTEQVHVAIHQAAKDGIERMTIQLDPVDLGRVEINMAKGIDGHTQITFLVDKPETFDGLSRDARMLERSLQEAGIKADTGSMQFNLRQQPQGQQLQSGLGGNGQQTPQQQSNAEDAVSSASSVSGLTAMDSATRNYLFNVREGVDISA